MKRYVRINERLEYKKSTDGEFIVYNFYQSNEYIGHIHIRLKKGWNQLHIEIERQFRNKGLSFEMINIVLNIYNYVSIPEGRIVNPLIYKIIEKFKKDSRYEVWQTEYEEWIISNKKVNADKINDIFK